jgi:hypothetical protein
MNERQISFLNTRKYLSGKELRDLMAGVTTLEVLLDPKDFETFTMLGVPIKYASTQKFTYTQNGQDKHFLLMPDDFELIIHGLEENRFRDLDHAFTYFTDKNDCYNIKLIREMVSMNQREGK